VRNVLVLLLVTILGLLTSFAFYFYFGAGNITDLLVAKTIPKYPNATSWLVSATTGFPDASPSGNISFETNDTGDSVIDYYKMELEKLGWTKQATSSVPGYAPYATFKKTIGGTTFTAHVTKDQTIQYSSQRGRFSIVSHGR